MNTETYNVTEQDDETVNVGGVVFEHSRRCRWVLLWLILTVRTWVIGLGGSVEVVGCVVLPSRGRREAW